MSVLNRTPKIDPAAMYVCLDGHVSKAGIYPEGARLRGSHPAVQTVPTHWIEDGLSDDEMTAARVARGMTWRPRGTAA